MDGGPRTSTHGATWVPERDNQQQRSRIGSGSMAAPPNPWRHRPPKQLERLAAPARHRSGRQATALAWPGETDTIAPGFAQP